MVTIVGIHGIAQQFRGGYQLGTVWLDAVRDGLRAAGYRRRADRFAPDELSVAYFGDLFRPAGTMGAQGPPFSAADIGPGLERELLVRLYEEAVTQDPALGPPDGAMRGGRATVQMMLQTLLKSGTFATVAQRAFIGDLKQVTQFLTDASVKDVVLRRVDDEVSSQTRVLIGHSLGSVVAYEYLCRYQPASISVLITLGSPLGIPRLVFDRLTPRPISGLGKWPGQVTNWVNVADPNDIVALRKKIAGLFGGAADGGVLDDRLVHNGDQPHAVDRYLNARETGSALADVLG